MRRTLSKADESYFEDESRVFENAPPSTTLFCHVCDAIIHGFTAPLEENYSSDLGTVAEVMSSPCDVHKDLITWFIGDWEEQSFGDHSLSIFKHPSDCYLELLRDDMLYPPFELVGEIPLDTSNLNTSRIEAKTQIFGRGQSLDEYWIRFDTIKHWYQMCRDEHGAACHSPLVSQDLNATPDYFIDTQDNCIVPSTLKDRYICLSYVWGHVSSLQLQKANINTLTTQGALRKSDIIDRIPLTILHAIGITRLLGERYLWVDSLCIVQDDESGRKQEQLNNMTAIYANASVTLIAADGSDAGYGLRGLQDISRPIERRIYQECLPFPPYGNIVHRIFPPKNERSKEDMIKPYFCRGWTFQEYHFSKRRLVFEKQSVYWECSCATLFEDVNCSDGVRLRRSSSAHHNHLLASTVPRLHSFTRLVEEYNKKNLTYEEDCLPALSGTLSALSQIFEGGFISGLPELFFDVALLWQPIGPMKRRQSSRSSEDSSQVSTAVLPSWSWAGWNGAIDPWSWQSGYDFVKLGDIGAQTSRETIPITTWYFGAQRETVTREMYDHKNKYRDPTQPLAEGWTRHASPGRGAYHGSTQYFVIDSPPPEGFGSCFYTHVACPKWQFWYPIPLCVARANLTTRNTVKFLFSTVQAVDLYTDSIFLRFHTASVSLRDDSGQWAGILRPHCGEEFPQTRLLEKKLIRLIAISLGRAKNSKLEKSLEEWELDERPKNTFWYEFYNVLWISQDRGITYRKGIGRVRKEIWESQNMEKLDVVLG